MIRQRRLLPGLFIIVLFVSVISIPRGESCKDIVVTSAATAGNYSLLLKVRDPSRNGLQVLCRVPKGTQYTYHHPWTGKPWDFTITHGFIGVTTKGDTLPHIVKAGMVLTDAGLAFGDADTMSRWVNPTQNAWDDFDWIRYAYQSAETEEDAIRLLTTEAVDKLHATGVSENLFVVGPQRAVVIEADATHYSITDVGDVLVMSNYAKDLWRTRMIKSLPVASSFDKQKETWVRGGVIVHLGSLCGVRIIRINTSGITAKVFPSFAFTQSGLDLKVSIPLGKQAVIGPYCVRLLEIKGKTARISISTTVYAWEKEMLSKINPVVGNITLQHVMDWSRLHSNNLDGLRSMCEDINTYEAAMIFKIPSEHASLLGNGWFAPNHPCSSIYVPIHICDDDIHDPYETGEAATLCLELLQKYGHGNLTSLCQGVENVFVFENEINEYLAYLMILNGMNISSFLTGLDQGMQEQAFLTEQLWLYAPNISHGIIQNLWKKNYTVSLQQMQQASNTLRFIKGSEPLVYLIEQIKDSIQKSKRMYQDSYTMTFQIKK